MQLGITPGPAYREILGELRAAWLDGRVRSKEEKRSCLSGWLKPGEVGNECPGILPPTGRPWLAGRVVIRPVTAADLPLLEWEEEIFALSPGFSGAFERQLAGLSVLWIAVLDCWAAGQVFIQYDSDRKELADGVERAYLYSLRVRPELRGRAWSTRIHQVVEEDLLQRTYRYITLNVAKEKPAPRHSIGGWGTAIWLTSRAGGLSGS